MRYIQSVLKIGTVQRRDTDIVLSTLMQVGKLGLAIEISKKIYGFGTWDSKSLSLAREIKQFPRLILKFYASAKKFSLWFNRTAQLGFFAIHKRQCTH